MAPFSSGNDFPTECGAPEVEPLPEFLDPITNDVMVDPVLVVESGHTYERGSIERWLQQCREAGRAPSCPLTGLLVTGQLVSNYTLKSLVQRWANRNLISDVARYSRVRRHQLDSIPPRRELSPASGEGSGAAVVHLLDLDSPSQRECDRPRMAHAAGSGSACGADAASTSNPPASGSASYPPVRAAATEAPSAEETLREAVESLHPRELNGPKGGTRVRAEKSSAELAEAAGDLCLREVLVELNAIPLALYLLSREALPLPSAAHLMRMLSLLASWRQDVATLAVEADAYGALAGFLLAASPAAQLAACGALDALARACAGVAGLDSQRRLVASLAQAAGKSGREPRALACLEPLAVAALAALRDPASQPSAPLASSTRLSAGSSLAPLSRQTTPAGLDSLVPSATSTERLGHQLSGLESAQSFDSTATQRLADGPLARAAQERDGGTAAGGQGERERTRGTPAEMGRALARLALWAVVDQAALRSSAAALGSGRARGGQGGAGEDDGIRAFDPHSLLHSPALLSVRLGTPDAPDCFVSHSSLPSALAHALLLDGPEASPPGGAGGAAAASLAALASAPETAWASVAAVLEACERQARLAAASDRSLLSFMLCAGPRDERGHVSALLPVVPPASPQPLPLSLQHVLAVTWRTLDASLGSEQRVLAADAACHPAFASLLRASALALPPSRGIWASALRVLARLCWEPSAPPASAVLQAETARSAVAACWTLLCVPLLAVLRRAGDGGGESRAGETSGESRAGVAAAAAFVANLAAARSESGRAGPGGGEGKLLSARAKLVSSPGLLAALLSRLAECGGALEEEEAGAASSSLPSLALAASALLAAVSNLTAGARRSLVRRWATEEASKDEIALASAGLRAMGRWPLLASVRHDAPRDATRVLGEIQRDVPGVARGVQCCWV